MVGPPLAGRSIVSGPFRSSRARAGSTLLEAQFLHQGDRVPIQDTEAIWVRPCTHVRAGLATGASPPSQSSHSMVRHKPLSRDIPMYSFSFSLSTIPYSASWFQLFIVNNISYCYFLLCLSNLISTTNGFVPTELISYTCLGISPSFLPSSTNFLQREKFN